MHSANPEAPAAPLHFNFATDVIDRWAQERPEAPALWCVNAATGAEQKFSFRQLAALSCQAADFLRSSGVRRGDRVLVMLPRVPQWWIAMLGLIRLGAVPVPATLLLTARDVAYRLGSARISAVITNPDGVAKVGGFEGTRLLVGGERPGWLDFDRGVREASAGFRGEPTRSDEPGDDLFHQRDNRRSQDGGAHAGELRAGPSPDGPVLAGPRTGGCALELVRPRLGQGRMVELFGPWQMGACVFALDVPGKFDPVLALKRWRHPDYDVVRAADGAAADRAAGFVGLAVSASAALRQRGRAAEPGSAEPLAGRDWPDAARGLRPDGNRWCSSATSARWAMRCGPVRWAKPRRASPWRCWMNTCGKCRRARKAKWRCA